MEVRAQLGIEFTRCQVAVTVLPCARGVGVREGPIIMAVPDDQL